MDITEVVYNSLISLNNTNEFYKGENEEINMNLSIELLSFCDFILEKDELSNENHNFDFEIGCHIIASILENDEYSWFYQDKNQKKKILYF